MLVSRSRGWQDSAVRQLAWFHRWLGVATCLIFALWFASGAVLLFVPFPSLPRGAQMSLQAPVDLTAVAVTPGQAMALAGGKATALRLIQRGDHPAYVVDTGQALTAIDARTGWVLPLVTADEARRVSARASGQPVAIGDAFDYDQWVVHNRFDPLRPFYRLDIGDSIGMQLYLSARTGELVQRTSRVDRAWNWVGAVLHWAYFTPLRSSFTAWDRTVWVLSFIAMLVAVAGTILGVIRTVAAQRQRKGSLSFYRLKWMRWHHILGLFASVFVLTWILSGWLSMDHGRLFSRGQATPAQLAAYHGRPLAAAVQALDLSTLRTLSPAAEISFDVIGGELVVVASGQNGATLVYNAVGSIVTPAALTALASRGVMAAWPMARAPDVGHVAASDVYALAEGWPASTEKFTPGYPHTPSVYIDGSSGRLLTVMDESRAAYAWIYYALHTFNFPGLTTRPVLRDVLVMVPLMLGLAFSLTGVVIGVRRVGKSVRS